VALHALKLAKPEIVTAGEESDDHFGEVGDVEGQERQAERGDDPRAEWLSTP